MKRWEKDSRYYMACIQQDLLGDWNVLKVWGSRVSRLGFQSVEIVDSYEEGKRRLAEIDRIRVRRGYKYAVDAHTSLKGENSCFNDRPNCILTPSPFISTFALFKSSV